MIKAKLEIQYIEHCFSTDALFREYVEVTFEQADEIDAPIAVEWPDGATRWYQGNHYRYVTGIFEDDLPAHKQESAVQAYFTALRGGTNRDACTFNYLGRHRKYEGRIHYRWKFDARRHPTIVDSPERLRWADRARRFAADSLLVGGVLWLKCAPPRLLIKTSKDGESHTVTVDTTIRSINHKLLGDIKYPTLEMAARTFPITPSDEHELQHGVADEVIVLLPDSLGDDLLEELIREASEALILLQANGRLYLVGEVVSRRISTLRNYLFGRPDGSVVDHEFLADVLAECRDNIQGNHKGIKAALTEILVRWENRPISLECAA